MVMMPRMVSAASLSAFAGSVAATLNSARTGTIPGLLPIRGQGSSGKAEVERQRPAALLSATQRRLRGSMLNLQA